MVFLACSALFLDRVSRSYSSSSDPEVSSASSEGSAALWGVVLAAAVAVFAWRLVGSEPFAFELHDYLYEQQ